MGSGPPRPVPKDKTPQATQVPIHTNGDRTASSSGSSLPRNPFQREVGIFVGSVLCSSFYVVHPATRPMPLSTNRSFLCMSLYSPFFFHDSSAFSISFPISLPSFIYILPNFSSFHPNISLYVLAEPAKYRSSLLQSCSPTRRT